MTRNDLKNYKHNQQWIKGRLEYIEEYRVNVEKITSTLTGMQGSNKQVNDSMAEKLAQLMDTINDVLKKTLEENKKQREILKQLDKVEQPYKLILEKVYIQGKTLVTVASEMGYDYKHMCYKNGIALIQKK